MHVERVYVLQFITLALTLTHTGLASCPLAGKGGDPYLEEDVKVGLGLGC